MSKASSIILGIAVVALVSVGVYFLWAEGTDNSNLNQGDELELASSTDILVISPRVNAAITSPLTVQGEARGPWYFEATFPITLLDGNGEKIGESYVQADGEWMTEEFVPFSGTITFNKPNTVTGTLILAKANPSGLDENAGELRVPVRFEEETMVVKIFLGNSEMNPQADCQTVYPVERTVSRTVAVASSSINELLKGPTNSEKENEYFTSIPEQGVELQSIRIENGTAYADFNEKLDEGVGGSCRVAMIFSQIASTLRQFETVENVVLSIDGRTEDILQP